MPLPPELAVATLREVRAVVRRVAGELAEFAGELRASSDKGGVDVVTRADGHSESALTAELHRLFPQHRVCAEEGTVLGPAGSAWTWHVDPLDGTANYSRALPYWAISVGLAHGEEPVLGCVVAPRAGIDLVGAVGVGAWAGDAPLPAATPAGDPRGWIIATDWPWAVAERARTAALIAAMGPHVRQYKTFGSAAVDFAHIALGLVDAYAISDIFRWDQCGGAAILRALGYDLRTWDGARWDLARRDICACRPGMWERLGDWLQPGG